LAAAVAACDGVVPAERVISVLTSLASQSLLQSNGPERTGGPSMFRQLVAIRAHAGEQLDLAADRDAARAAVARWVIDLITDGVRLGHPGQAEWYELLDDNRRTIVATLEREIADAPHDELLVAASHLDSYWIDRRHQADGRRVASSAVRALGPQHSVLASAATRATYGLLIAVDQQPDEVRTVLEGAIVDLTSVPVVDRLVAADRLAAVAIWSWAGDDDALATMAIEALAVVSAELDDPHLELAVRAVRGIIQVFADPATASAAAASVLGENEGVGNDFWALVACATFSIVAQIEHDGEAGLRWTDRLLELDERLGNHSIADTLETRGTHYVNAGRPADAVRCYGAASYQNGLIGRRWPRHAPTATQLEVARDQLSDHEFAAAWASGERLGASNLVRDWL